MSRRAAHLISHEKLHVSAQLCPRCLRPVPSRPRHAHDAKRPFIHNALFSNQEPPDAIRSGHFRNDHALPIRHIGADLKAARSSIPLSLSLSLSRSVSRSFHRSPSSCLVLLDVDLVKRDLASRIFHDPCVSADTRIDNHDESILSSILPASYLIPSIPDVVLRKFRFSGTICRPRIWESISRIFPISSMQL